MPDVEAQNRGRRQSPFRRVRVRDVMALDREMIQIVPATEYVSVGVKSYGNGVFHYPPRLGSDLGKLSFFEVHPGCLLVSNIMAWEGAVAVTTNADADCVASSRFLPYFVDTGQVNLDYLQYYFAIGPGHLQIQWASTGSAKRNRTLGISRFEGIEFPLPPLGEQKKIAAILSSVDNAIQKTQQVVDQTRQVKKGLLQELLTKGIGRDGRPHTRFKKTPIGLIPEEWQAKHLTEMVTSRDSDRIPVKAEERKARQGPFRYFGASGVIDMIDDYIFDGPHLLVAEDGFNLLRRKTPIAFVVDGKYWVNNHAHVLSAKQGTDLQFVAACFEQLDVRPFLTGFEMPKLNAKTLATIKLPCPPPHEQKGIAARLGAIDKLIADSQCCLEQLRITKSGLLQDLLTGKVRVTP